MMKTRIFLSAPHMSGTELAYVTEAFEKNYVAPVGEFIERFEESVRRYTGAEAAVALSSGTAAIHLALRLCGVGEGDVVAASSFTFIGSVAPILYQGASPLFVDCDESWNVSPSLLEKAFDRYRPKAFILTHLYGQPAKLEEIVELCDHFGVILIEDAAESLGALYRGKHTGTFGEFGIYSFNGNKIITTSGGGMLVAKDPERIEHARKLATQAREHLPWYEHEEVGYNYRMSNVLAAIGVGQMEVIEERVEKKRQIFEWYRELMGDRVEWMPELSGCRGNRWLSACAFQGASPLEVIEALAEENIEARPLWKPMHMQPAFHNADRMEEGASERLFSRGVCLPSGTTLERKDVERICAIVRKVS
jgi:UDP-N-acetylbacillosamine transaminase